MFHMASDDGPLPNFGSPLADPEVPSGANAIPEGLPVDVGFTSSTTEPTTETESENPQAVPESPIANVKFGPNGDAIPLNHWTITTSNRSSVNV